MALNIDAEIIIMIIIQLVSIGIWIGQANSFKKRVDEKMGDFKEQLNEHKRDFNVNLKRLEEKQDRHNHLIERMGIVERDVKSAHHRIDGLEQKNR